jgi:hypothetical protein
VANRRTPGFRRTRLAAGPIVGTVLLLATDWPAALIKRTALALFARDADCGGRRRLHLLLLRRGTVTAVIVYKAKTS